MSSCSFLLSSCLFVLWQHNKGKTKKKVPKMSKQKKPQCHKMHLWIWLVLPFSSSCFFSPTVFGLPRPLRMGSDWLLARGLLLFSMSLVRGHSILSLRMRSVLLRLKSSLSKAGITNTTCCLAICSGGSEAIRRSFLTFTNAVSVLSPILKPEWNHSCAVDQLSDLKILLQEFLR